MRKIIIPIAVFASCVAIGGLIYSQTINHRTAVEQDEPDFEEISAELSRDLKEIAFHFDTLKTVSIVGQYTLTEYPSEKLLETEPIVFIKQNEILYSAVGGLEEIYNDGNVASINNYLRMIYATKPDKKIKNAEKGLKGWQLFIDGMSTSGIKVKVEDDSGKRKVTFQADSTGLYQPVEISYDPQTKRLNHYSLLTKVMVPGSDDYSEKRVVLSMVITKYSDKIDDNGFKNKIQWNRREVMLADSLKDYQLQFLD